MATITVSDYIVKFLVAHGIHHTFYVSGGGIMYLTDAIARNTSLIGISTHHEQAAAIAAESYARMTNHISSCIVTTGPGATNAITGVACAWYDSIPLMVISGQQKRELIADYSRYRNLGPQEVPITAMVAPITKYATLIREPVKIRYELEKAFTRATTGRPGPVWLDIPLDVQGQAVKEEVLMEYHGKKFIYVKTPTFTRNVHDVIRMRQIAKRPLLIIGNGVRLSHAESLLGDFLRKVQMPIVLPFNGMDLVPENHPFLVGKFGPGGQRRGNFALQNSDLILSIGASLNISSIGFDVKNVAPHAKKIMVNIDKHEMTKPTVSVDTAVCADAKEFIGEFLKQTTNIQFSQNKKWVNVCRQWKKTYPTIVADHRKDTTHVNSYMFYDVLSDALKASDTVVTGIGLDAVSMYQALRIKKGQRAYVNKNFGPMGWCLPASVGACIGNNKKRTVLVTGDGSIQFNIQELETIKYYHLPIKIFVFNNKGYESIRATQQNLFDGRLFGADMTSGVSNPDFRYLARAHDIKYTFIATNRHLRRIINNVLNTPGPVLCEVNVAYDQKRMPKAVTYRDNHGKLQSRPLQDMAPLLPRQEIEKNMHYFD